MSGAVFGQTEIRINAIMKNSVIILATIVVVAGGVYTTVRRGEQRNAEAEMLARKAEAAQRKAEEGRKKSEAEARKAKDEAAAAKSRAEAARLERQAKLAAEAEAKELANARAAEARKAEAETKIAAENSRRAEHERKAAEARKAETEAIAAYAAATNAARQAELDAAALAERALRLDLEKTLAASNVLALQKADYAAKLVEVERLQEELRRREEETRPNKTLMQLIAQNDAAREAELAEMAKRDAQFAEEEAIRRRILREGVPAAPTKPLSATEQRIAAAGAALDDVDSEGRTAVQRRIVERMEALIRQAVADGRTDDAESYIKTLKSLVPDYGNR